VCDAVEGVEDLLRDVFTFFVIANFDFCNIRFYRSGLLNRKCFCFNSEVLNFFEISQLRQLFADAVDISVSIEKISSSVLFRADKYRQLCEEHLCLVLSARNRDYNRCGFI